MRVLLISLFAFFVAFTSYSKTITVSNNSADIAMYSNLQTAIDSAEAGDVIYVFSSPTSYGNITINKKLTLIGAGYNKTITSLNVTKFNKGSENSQLFGFLIGGVLSIHADSNITISRSLLGRSIDIKCRNVMCYNNVIYNFVGGGHEYGICNYLNVNNSENLIITNNIFIAYQGYTCGDLISITNSNKNSVLINNNVFFNVNTNASCFSNISNAIIDNNIFYKVKTSGLSNCFLNNNIVYNGTDSLPYGNNQGEGNINGLDPQFLDMKNLQYFTLDGDYRLKDTSPGKNAGSDGKDIGLFGGLYPWPLYEDGKMNYSLLTDSHPTIREFSILVNPVGQNGKVKFKARSVSPNKK